MIPKIGDKLVAKEGGWDKTTQDSGIYEGDILRIESDVKDKGECYKIFNISKGGYTKIYRTYLDGRRSFNNEFDIVTSVEENHLIY